MIPKTPILAALAAAALIVLPASAPAAVTASAVSTPAEGSAYDAEPTAPAHIPTVSGTASGAGNVDVRCAHQDGSTWVYSSVLAASLPVAGDGTWSASDVALPTNRALCRLIAVPEGTSPTDPSAFTGPRLRLLITSPIKDNKGGGNQGKQYDFAGSAAGPTADAYLDSVGSGGVDETLLLSAAPGEQGEVFGSADYIRDTDPTTGPDPDATATGITIDGLNSFLGASWEQQVTPSLQLVFYSYTPFPMVTVTRSIASDGSFVVTEHDLISRCTNNPNYYPPQGATCTGLEDTGVVLDVTTTINPAGTVVSRQWSFSSTDGHTHAVHLVQVDNAGTNSGSRTWRFPGEAGYAAHTNGDVIALPAQAPWTARFHTEGAADGDAAEGVGAIAFGQVPGSLRFTAAYALVPTASMTVPATGDVKLRAILMSEATQAALEADIAAAEAALSGTTATPAPGGGTPPPPGAGDTTVSPALPRLLKRGKARLKRGRLSLGYALDCPGAGPACSAVVAIAGKRSKVLAKATIKAAAGRTVRLVVKISKRNRAKLRHARLTLKATLRRPPLAATTVRRKLRLG